ncbi:hypothetical protein N8I77_013566 [Diaporthe amygdali]|uniref:Uncharacterized protein n=1 Tax=Phomopsis amygdali TaxID=1214568 RepID=A0AAD9S0Y6_PHOAM|nr:hypothetical protein N8I77_013566 [Diaporthe amygdali]
MAARGKAETRRPNGQTAAMAASTATATQDVTTVYRARNVLGPLTTAFTAPQDCDFAAILGDSLTLAYRAQTCVGERLEDVSTCWPQVTAAAPLNSPPFNGWGFYSPGISCPAGYTSACFATQGSRTGWDMQFPMDVGETAVGCCPTNFACTTFGNGQTCVQTASDSLLTAHCSGGSFVSTGDATFPIESTSTDVDTSLITSVMSLAVAAPMIQINWRSEDLAAATSSLSPSSTTSGSTSGDFIPANTQTVSSSNATSSISPGALAGAVIGGVVGLFSIAAAIFFFLRQRKTRANINEEALKQPRSDKPKGAREGVTELPLNQRPVELQGSRDPSELSEYQRPVELPAS